VAILPDFWLKPEAATAYQQFSPEGVGIHPNMEHSRKRELIGDMPVALLSFHIGPFEGNASMVATRFAA